jgi:alpha-L-rhamnosidase
VASSWRRTPAGLELDVIVPPNARGRVYLPAANARAVTDTVKGAADVRFAGKEGDRLVYEIGSGQYQFRVAAEK